MNKIQELDFHLKNKFPNLITKLNKPTIAPDNTIIWFLDIEDPSSKQISIIIEWCESKDDFEIIDATKIIGYGWCNTNSKICSTLEETINETIKIIVNDKQN